MARRFGGTYSPDGGGKANRSDDPAAASRDRAVAEANRERRLVEGAGKRASVLFAPPAILLLTSLDDGPVALVAAIVGAAVLTLGAWLLREGLKAAAAYDARAVARRPALPRKALAAVLAGIGVGIAAFVKDGGVAGSALYGLAAAALHVAAFGLDPMKDKLAEGIDRFQQDRVARVVDEAEAHLAAMRGQIAALGDRKLDLRVEAFQAVARKMIRTVEQDPRDLTEARKYLGVYLMGARDASARFAELYARNRDPAARADYEALLTDLETNFVARSEKMLSNDRSEMDIEIKVLRDRLQREGV